MCVDNLYKTLISLSIESILNVFICHSSPLKTACRPLDRKILRISLKEFPSPLVLIFNERRVNILDSWEGEVDCSLIICLETLIKLRDQQQLIDLIFNGDIKIEGDMQTVRNFIALINCFTKFDLTELLVPYIGDVAAESIRKIFHEGMVFLNQEIQRRQRYISEILTEELRIIPSSPEVAWFVKEIVVTKRAVDTLVKRIEKLEDR